METKITNLEITMAELKTDIKYIKQALETNDEQHREIIKNQEAYMREMRIFIEKVIAEKADKWVENTFIWTIRVIGTAILAGVIALVAQVYLYLNK